MNHDRRAPVGELRERAAELAFQTGDVGAVADALEPLKHQRRISLYCRTCAIGVCGTQSADPAPPSGSPHLRIVRDVTGEIDLAAVQRAASVNARAPNQPMSSTAIICNFVAGRAPM